MMKLSIPVAAMILFAGLQAPVAVAQSIRATSPGQSGASNTLPQAPSGGAVGGMAAGGAMPGGSAAGQTTDTERKAENQARKATEICKGC